MTEWSEVIMRAVIRLELMKNIQDRGLVFWTLILPIIFTVLFISVFTSGQEGVVKEKIIISIVPGYITMFVFFIMITMVDTFIKDLDNGMTARLASTPLSPYSYLLGKWIPYIFIVFTQIIILFLFGKIVYDIPMEQPVIIIILSGILAFTVTGLGLALAILVKTFNMGLAITQIISLGGALLSGLWVPIHMMPNFFQSISKFLPQFWAHQAYQDAMTGGLSRHELLSSATILFAFVIIGFIIAIFQYPYFLKRARS